MAAAVILNEFVDTKQIYHSFHDFITGNTVVGMTAGIVVGIGTYNLIRATTFDMVIPLLNWIIIGGLRLVHMPTYKFLDRFMFRGRASFNFAHFIQEVIIWGVMLFVTYVVLKQILSARRNNAVHDSLNSHDDTQ